MKIYFRVIIVVAITSFGFQTRYIDPTGTYKMDNETIQKDGDTYGYFGGIWIRKISDDRIAMSFDICKGAPNYNSGSFLDTLEYKNNRAVYQAHDIDTTCIITFTFLEKGITVDQQTQDLNMGCGFGHGVVAHGFFKKISSREPDLTNPE